MNSVLTEPLNENSTKELDAQLFYEADYCALDGRDSQGVKS